MVTIADVVEKELLDLVIEYQARVKSEESGSWEGDEGIPLGRSREAIAEDFGRALRVLLGS